MVVTAARDRLLRHSPRSRRRRSRRSSTRATVSWGSSRSPIGRGGAGQKLGVAPVKALAMAAGLPVVQPERLKDPAFLEAFAAMGADLGVVAAYGRIIPRSSSTRRASD